MVIMLYITSPILTYLKTGSLYTSTLLTPTRICWLPQVTTDLMISFPMRFLFVLDSICKWDHILFVFLCLACFMEHNALRVPPCGHKWQDFLLLKVGTAVRCTYTAHDFYPLAPRCTPSLFPRQCCLWVVCRECWSPGTAPRSWLQFPWENCRLFPSEPTWRAHVWVQLH